MKEQINEELRKHFNDRFIELWWYSRLPGLGNRSPFDVFEKDPQSLLDYVLAYEPEN